MAINTANSNFVNINNLPQSQEVLGTDLLIIQTENGTQTISYNDLNVIKTSPTGDTVLPGNLTGSSCFFQKTSSNEISSPVYKTSRATGSTNCPLAQYFNRFTVDSGLITSATYVTNSSPDYNNITGTFVPGVTAYLGSQFKKVYELWPFFTGNNENANYVTFEAGMSAADVTVEGFFSLYNNELTVGMINNPSYFILQCVDPSPVNALPALNPYVTNIGKSGTALTFTIRAGRVMGTSTSVKVYYRFLYYKTI